MGVSRKRLAIVVPTHYAARMGGSQYQAKCLVESLVALDKYEIFFLSRFTNPNYSPSGYKVFPISKVYRFEKYGHLFNTPYLIQALNCIKPDIIYQRVANPYTGITAYFARRNNAKMVWHVAGQTDVQPLKCYSRVTPSLKYFISYLEKKVTEHGIRHADRIIAQTQQQAALLKRYYGRTVSAIIPNFHPFPAEPIRKTLPIKIVWIANLKPLKQPELFLRLARECPRQNGVRFIMVGGLQGNLNWRKKILAKISKVNNLTYCGPSSQEQVNVILSGAHILVNTSIHEGFPNTFIQAWMRKVPVVSLNVDPDNVLAQRNLGFCSKSFSRLLEDVNMLVKNQDLTNVIGERAQEYAFERHSLGNISRIIKILEN